MTGYSFLVLILLLSQFFKPLLGRTRSRGKCWAAIRLSNRPGRMGGETPKNFFVHPGKMCWTYSGYGLRHYPTGPYPAWDTRRGRVICKGPKFFELCPI